ncbi:putative pentatricopeptide repeat-containing protein [Raphanus sativus]|uniref:Pentatricopeptide repeat-containing protein At1g19290 n=1 Tax=Raphanus sativus TaxID=3726 RepID=A0A6J0KRN6_RAPSA|nr:putative pentatricopeptide repeat-containing protein At1g19290 [Raphanus sativus]KAJ4879509.1 putative pentatricopeptide repeat-containing protein [Raphanus sativus]
MLLRSPARHVAFQMLLLHSPRRFSDASRSLRRHLRAGQHARIPPELIERVSRLLVLGRYDALHDLSLDFSDRLLNSLLRASRLHPEACLEVFSLASKQQTFRPDYKSYCKIVHILSRARMHDRTRAYLRELVGLNHSCYLVWDELVRVFKSFRFSPTVFDMVLKVYAEKGLVKEALHVFDNMGGRGLGRVPSLLSCNSLLSCLVRKGESFVALRVYDQMRSLGVSPDVFTCSIVVNAYCREGEVERAMEFAEEMEMNVVTFNSLVNGYAVSGDLEGVARVLGLMSERGVSRNVVTYTSLIKCYCKKGLMEEAEKVFESVEEADQPVYGVLIDGYCRSGKVSDAVRVHDEMLRKGVRTNETICNSLINGYCKAGRLVAAERMLMRMKEWSLKPDHYTYNTLVDGYCRAGHVDEALKLCDRMCEKEVVPTVMTYNTLLKGFSRVGAYHEVLNLWKTMTKRGVSGDEVSCSTLLEALFKLGDFDEAMKLWENVLARGLLTDTVTLNVMISGLCKMEKVNEAREILDSVKTFRCKPDVQTYQALSHGYYKAGKLKEAFEVKDYMESKGMFPTIEMYSTLISAAFKCRHLNKVTDLVTELRARGLTPTVATYGALITGWCNTGAMDKAYATCLEMIEEGGIEVNVNICSKIATSLFRLGKIDEACLLLRKLVDFDLLLPGYQSFKEFLSPGAATTTCVKTQKIADSVANSTTTPKKVLVPNNVVYNVALAGLCKAGKLKEARKLFSELILREGFSPDEYTYTILIHGCAVDGDVNEAFNLRDEMSVKGITPNVVTYNALIKGLCKSGNLDRAQRLLRKLPHKGITPNAITYNTIIDGLMRSGCSDEAMRLKDKMVEKGLVRGGVSYKQGDGDEKVNQVLDPVIKSGISSRQMEEDSDEVYDVRIVSRV